jgi:hypothetical protein
MKKKIGTRKQVRALKIISLILLGLALVFLVNAVFQYSLLNQCPEVDKSHPVGFNPWNNIMKSLDIDDRYWITTNWNLAFALFLLMIVLMLRIRIRIVNSDDKDKNNKMDEHTERKFDEDLSEFDNHKQPEEQHADYSEPVEKVHFTCPYCSHNVITTASLGGTRISCTNDNCRKKIKVPYKNETGLFSQKNTFSCILIIVLITLAIAILVFGSL